MAANGHSYGSPQMPFRTLIVGAGEGAKLLVRELVDDPAWGFTPIGFVDDEVGKVGLRVQGLPVLGSTLDIPRIVARDQVDVVIIAIPSAGELVFGRIAEIAGRSGAKVLTMPSIGSLLRGHASTRTLRGVLDTDILGRSVVAPDIELCRRFVAGRRVIVTGAAGSIGSEVARQVAQLEPELLLGLDINESDLFDLQQELRGTAAESALQPVVASVTDRRKVERIFRTYQPEVVFHAAAYKHVPMMEAYPEEAVKVNAIGTFDLAEIAGECGAHRFVLVSTDKAVRPSSVMGSTKRLAEIIVNALATDRGLSACAVRFGNVLGSRGSVIPLFERQIASGGPVTVTDARMRRYFMTIREAASLIIQAGAFGDRGVIYMLDMGDEVSILDLARRMIELHGLKAGTDIDVVFTGLRPGEKLREDLSHDFEAARPTTHAKIRILREPPEHAPGLAAVELALDRLRAAVDGLPADAIRDNVLQAIAQLDSGGAAGGARETATPVPALGGR